jgi:hypothetical protein
MLYPECEQKFSGHAATPAAQHLGLLSPHLSGADYAAMSLSPKYNTAFSVTSLLNPARDG